MAAIRPRRPTPPGVVSVRRIALRCGLSLLGRRQCLSSLRRMLIAHLRGGRHTDSPVLHGATRRGSGRLLHNPRRRRRRRDLPLRAAVLGDLDDAGVVGRLAAARVVDLAADFFGGRGRAAVGHV